MKTHKRIVKNLREFTNNNCNTTLDPKLCEDIRYLCDEVERLNLELVKANQHMDKDYITIQKYKRKLEAYEPF
jgi:hypothetical protein